MKTKKERKKQILQEYHIHRSRIIYADYKDSWHSSHANVAVVELLLFTRSCLMPVLVLCISMRTHQNFFIRWILLGITYIKLQVRTATKEKAGWNAHACVWMYGERKKYADRLPRYGERRTKGSGGRGCSE